MFSLVMKFYIFRKPKVVNEVGVGLYWTSVYKLSDYGRKCEKPSPEDPNKNLGLKYFQIC